MNRYINQEISWLKFNSRVLEEAKNNNIPLLERIRFLGIYFNNLDEFYKIRYADLVRSILIDKKLFYNIIENQKTTDLLKEINQIIFYQKKKYDILYNKIFKDLQKENIYMIKCSYLVNEHKNFIKKFFIQKIIPSLVIVFCKKKNFSSYIKDSMLYLVVRLVVTKKKKEFVFIEVPTNLFSRFIILPSINNKKYFIFLEDIIKYHVKDIFSFFQFQSLDVYSIKINRDAELIINNKFYMSFIDSISQSLKNRNKANPMRLIYDKNMSNDLLNYVRKILKINDYKNLIPGDTYHNKKDFMNFPNFQRYDLEYKKIKPIIPKFLYNQHNYFQIVSKRDILLYSPYHDYTIVLKFLRKAAIDPMVEKIKITIYRVANNSQIMTSLINASKNGKEVVAVLELRARFDEEHNIYWSKILQSEGVKVIFGISELKIHLKICYIKRKKQIGFSEQYGIISTGNFNEKTSCFYTDFILITSNQKITSELKDVFHLFDNHYLIKKYKNLILSPWTQRNFLIHSIRNEIINKNKGLPAQINIKVNRLSDKEIIDNLYEASNQGVEIRLIIRGICSLIAGKKGLSKNIYAISIIDKFLEHTRMFWFKNGGEDKVYISSSDLMKRNLDHRVEISCPIFDVRLKLQIQQIFEFGVNDNIKGRIIAIGFNKKYQKNKEKIRSQESIYTYLLNI